jgi:branched-chain amino acid aminotransferase
MARTVWKDGNPVPWEQAEVSVLGHSIQRGSLVFDVGAIRETAAGVACFRPREHIQRFWRSAALVGLDVAWTEAALLEATLETVRANGLPSALVRWSALWPGLEGDVLPRRTSRASVVIAVITPADGAGPGESPAKKAESVRVGISREIRKAGPEVFPPQAKVAASYLGPMLAKRRAVDDGYDEVVLLDGEGYIAEAPTSNVFAVRGGVLFTPPTDRVLAGITRDSILELAHAEGIEAREERLAPDDLSSADEAFLTGTSLPVQAIGAVDGFAVGNGGPGPITAHLKALLLACERGEDPRFAHWIERV